MEALGEATLRLRADTTDLDADLEAAERRVKDSVARMQAELDRVHIRSIVHEEVQSAMREAARGASRALPSR